MLNDSKEKRIIDAADHRSEAIRGVPQCCWERKPITHTKLILLENNSYPEESCLSRFMYQMHDRNLEYWQAFCYFYFGYALPTSVEMSEKNLETR